VRACKLGGASDSKTSNKTGSAAGQSRARRRRGQPSSVQAHLLKLAEFIECVLAGLALEDFEVIETHAVSIADLAKRNQSSLEQREIPSLTVFVTVFET
jgi:hypothetical protein